MQHFCLEINMFVNLIDLFRLFFFLFKLLTDFELSDIDGFGVYNLLEETEVEQINTPPNT